MSYSIERRQGVARIDVDAVLPVRRHLPAPPGRAQIARVEVAPERSIRSLDRDDRALGDQAAELSAFRARPTGRLGRRGFEDDAGAESCAYLESPAL